MSGRFRRPGSSTSDPRASRPRDIAMAMAYAVDGLRGTCPGCAMKGLHVPFRTAQREMRIVYRLHHHQSG
jgi:hypothetical protein